MTGIIKIAFGTPYSEGVRIHAAPAVLSVFVNDSEAYFFDRSGRFVAAWRRGWFISLGLSGRGVARRWMEGKREIRTLTPTAIGELAACAARALRAACGPAKGGERLWLERAMTFDRAQDTACFRQVYRPVGILPPDHYNACVVQVTEGCGWNRCHFCSFYRGQAFRLKDREEILDHLERIAAFLGDGLSFRRSIFLGEANALRAPLDLLVDTMKAARRILVPADDGFPGVFFLQRREPKQPLVQSRIQDAGAAGAQARVFWSGDRAVRLARETAQTGNARKPGGID